MPIHVALHHETHYAYDRRVELGPQVIRLRPAPHSRTRIQSYSLHVEPEKHFLNWQQDPQSNWLARVLFPEKVDRFDVVVDLVAELDTINPFDFFLEPHAEQWPFEYDADDARELRPFLEQTGGDGAGPLLERWVADVPRTPTRTVDRLVQLNQRLFEDLEYLTRMEPGVQTPEETLRLARGSCRDSAWLLVQILRRLGIAARFASGYLVQLAQDVESLDGPSGPAADFTDLHAWAEAYLPGAGWVGLDPTSGLFAGEGHIPLACTPSPGSAAPVEGAVEKCEVEFGHVMRVERIFEPPRATRPYADEQWREIDAFGEAVDRRLEAGDVRLTLGGEPTFVSIDDPDGDEWHTDALGPAKRERADDLARRLLRRFGAGGLIQHSQGKWYPGEPLPRWAFHLYWRGDDEPLWSDLRRIALEAEDLEPTTDQARSLIEEVATQLGVDPSWTIPAWEDPLRVRPDTGETQEERLRGFVLPVQVAQARAVRRWRSEPWPLPRGRFYLIPGDSPLGYRLALDTLPEIPAAEYPHVYPRDPSIPAGPLPPRRQRRDEAGPAHEPEPAREPEPVRTALCVEPRDGRVCVFLPPVPAADDWVELVAAIDAASEKTGCAVHLEGYPPPPDDRLRSLSVTPDPGVIEVNVHPAASWQECKEITNTVYEEARLARLRTEKFLVDGRVTGTGGGNHVVLGGPTPLDSPFLRRPDLLRSLLGYWLNHPALSYLFSGLFIGPTSQAPRLDEARNDSLYELEIAFAQIPEPGGEIPPWIVDRVLRDLLTDATGNTHRAEFCIDKLYSPDSATGRRGLLELRAFEMPPHAQMSLAQQVLLRALVAWFWESPYRAPITRWGTTLHDRFMLPHFAWQDLCDVLADLRRAGFALRDEWFVPHYEFRFPRLGVVQYRDLEIELRHALEPWHVLGEDGAPGGTARYVDSSLERVQVRARGFRSEHHALGCNGRVLPIHGTGTQGEVVAGVRYRAWQPARCLHPTIGVHSPLVIDVVDRASGQSVAGCTYHVAHPGGRSHENFPVNENEAEGRRTARFSAVHHTPGRVELASASPHPEFPLTLDLRHPGGDA